MTQIRRERGAVQGRTDCGAEEAIWTTEGGPEPLYGEGEIQGRIEHNFAGSKIGRVSTRPQGAGQGWSAPKQKGHIMCPFCYEESPASLEGNCYGQRTNGVCLVAFRSGDNPDLSPVPPAPI